MNYQAFARYSLALFLIWTGVMRFLASDLAYYEKQLTQYHLEHFTWAGYLVGVFQLLLAAALLIPNKHRQNLLLTYSALALIPISMLFTHPVWIHDLGGFPAIGSGQGLIKYLAISGLALYLANKSKELREISLWLMLAGLVLVLGWIGGMKFTLIEAKGIEPLMKTSPLFSWIYNLFDVQGASNFIGIIELITLALLLCWRRLPKLFELGAALCLITFLGTLSFLFSFPGWDKSMGFPFLSSSGQFLLKDLLLLAATGLLYRHNKKSA